FGPKAVQLGPLRLRLPSLRLALLQLALAVVDITVSAAVVWVLLPPAISHGPIGFVAFAAIYAVAIALGVASHLPGGIGVFEGTVMLAFGHHVPLNPLAAALLLYRAIYYLGPLILATLVLGGFELSRSLGRPLQAPIRGIGRAAGRLMPPLLSALVFLA